MGHAQPEAAPRRQAHPRRPPHPPPTATPTGTPAPVGTPAATTGSLTVVRHRVSGSALSVLVNCAGAGSAHCAGRLVLSVVEIKQGGKLVGVTAAKSKKRTKTTVILATGTVTLA